jgi:hypothetical protein
MKLFQAKIKIIGINPYVLIPGKILEEIFLKAGKNKGPIPVKGTLNEKKFIQTLVKYSGKWRLYLNTPMRKSAKIDVGDIANVRIDFDPKPRIIEIHPKLRQELSKNKTAFDNFKKLSPSYRKEIIRYINNLKSDESIDRNVAKIIRHLTGKERFIGRDGVKQTKE